MKRKSVGKTNTELECKTVTQKLDITFISQAVVRKQNENTESKEDSLTLEDLPTPESIEYKIDPTSPRESVKKPKLDVQFFKLSKPAKPTKTTTNKGRIKKYKKLENRPINGEVKVRNNLKKENIHHLVAASTKLNCHRTNNTLENSKKGIINPPVILGCSRNKKNKNCVNKSTESSGNERNIPDYISNNDNFKNNNPQKAEINHDSSIQSTTKLNISHEVKSTSENPEDDHYKNPVNNSDIPEDSRDLSKTCKNYKNLDSVSQNKILSEIRCLCTLLDDCNIETKNQPKSDTEISFGTLEETSEKFSFTFNSNPSRNVHANSYSSQKISCMKNSQTFCGVSPHIGNYSVSVDVGGFLRNIKHIQKIFPHYSPVSEKWYQDFDDWRTN